MTAATNFSPQKSEQINELASALAKAQGEMGHAIKDSTNPGYRSKYADLAACWDACRGPLSKNQLAIWQGTAFEDGKVQITTVLMHSSGQWVSDTLSLVPNKIDPQGQGSAITYGRRYGLMAAVGLAPAEEDDGHNSSNRDTYQARAPLASDNHLAKNAGTKPAAGTIIRPKNGWGDAEKEPMCGEAELVELRSCAEANGWNMGAVNEAMWKICGQERLGAVTMSRFTDLIRHIRTFNGNASAGLMALKISPTEQAQELPLGEPEPDWAKGGTKL